MVDKVQGRCYLYSIHEIKIEVPVESSFQLIRRNIEEVVGMI